MHGLALPLTSYVTTNVKGQMYVTPCPKQYVQLSVPSYVAASSWALRRTTFTEMYVTQYGGRTADGGAGGCGWVKGGSGLGLGTVPVLQGGDNCRKVLLRHRCPLSRSKQNVRFVRHDP